MKSVFEYRIERFQFECNLGEQNLNLQDIMNEYGEDRWEVIKIDQKQISLDDDTKVNKEDDYRIDGSKIINHKIKVWGLLYLKRANDIL